MCFCQTCSTVSCQWVCYSLNDRKLEIKRWPGGFVQTPATPAVYYDRMDSSAEALLCTSSTCGFSWLLCFYHLCWTSCGPTWVRFPNWQWIDDLSESLFSNLCALWSLVVDVTTNALHPNSKGSSLYIRCSLQLQLLFHSISAFSVRALHPPHSLMVPFVPRDLARPTSRCWDLWWKTELLIQVSLHLPVLDSIQEYSSHSCRLICYTFTCSHICGRCLQVQEQGKGWHSGNSCSRSRMTAK